MITMLTCDTVQDVSTSSATTECRPAQPVWRPRFQFAGDPPPAFLPPATAPVLPVAGTDQVCSAAPGLGTRSTPLTNVEYAQSLMRERMRARAAQPGPAPSFMSALAPPLEALATTKNEGSSPPPAKKVKTNKAAKADKASATDVARGDDGDGDCGVGGVGTSRSSYFRAKRQQKAGPGPGGKATSTGRQIGRPQKLDAYADSVLRAELARNPATELKQLQLLVHRECNVEVSLSSISRRLKALGCSPAQQQSQARRTLASATPAYRSMALAAHAPAPALAGAGSAMQASSESSASRRTSAQSTSSSSSRLLGHGSSHAHLPPGHAPEFEFVHDYDMQPFAHVHGEAAAEHSYAADGLDLTLQMQRAMQEFDAAQSSGEASGVAMYFDHTSVAPAATAAPAQSQPQTQMQLQQQQGLMNGAGSAYTLLPAGMGMHNDFDFLNYSAARL